MITGCSGETLQVGPIAERNKVVTFAVLSSNKEIRHLGEFIFRTFIDVERGIVNLTDRMVSDGAKRVAVLTEDIPFTIGISKLVKENLKDKAVFSDFFGYDTLDFRTLIVKAEKAKPDAYYLSMGTSKTAAAMVNQLRQLNVHAPVYSFNMPGFPEFLNATKANANGVKFLSVPEIKSSIPEYVNFMKLYLKKYQEKPAMEFLARTTYDAIHAIFATIVNSGNNTEQAIKFLKSYRTNGALGAVEFDENGDIKNMDYVMKEIRDGEYVQLK